LVFLTYSEDAGDVMGLVLDKETLQMLSRKAENSRRGGSYNKRTRAGWALKEREHMS
jgi:hypothetical protein